jgi:tetratricopeptide (TPR) repeat protein
LLNNLGILAAERSQQELARKHFEESLALKQAALGPDHVDVGIAWQNLGALLSNIGDPRGALDALARARTIFAATVGEAHPWNIHLFFNSCHAEQVLGHPNEAIALCERALAGFASYPSPSLESRTRLTLAELLFDVGRQAEAWPMARRAVEVGKLENPELMAQWEQWLSTRDQTPENRP